MIKSSSLGQLAGTALLAGSVVLVSVLGACGKKEEAPPASAVAPAPETVAPPAPVSTPAPAPEAAAPAPAAPAAAPGEATPTAASDAETEMKKSDCFACHAVDKKLVGPAYSWVAFRYKGDKQAKEKLVAKIKNGGAGNWNAYTGGAPMTPHPQLTEDQLETMAKWVLSQAPVEPPKP
jgi:cytochrome c